MASFAGCTFRYRGNGAQTFPIWDKKDILLSQFRPTSTETLREVGMDVQRAAMIVRCTRAELLALYDQVLESGSLVTLWETHNALLESVDSASLVVTGNDVYEATLNLIRL